MSMAWMRMPGQGWLDYAGMFLGMWSVMMLAMMMPVVMPMLARYRRVVRARNVGALTAWVAGGYFTSVTLPEALPLSLAAGILVGAAVMASLVPAARASRIDVMQALRDE